MPTPSLNTYQRRCILQAFVEIHRRMSALESLMRQAGQEDPFSLYDNDFPPQEIEAVMGHFARLREALLENLRTLGIPLEVHPTSLLWAVQSQVMHLQTSVDDLGPKRLGSYGHLNAQDGEVVLRVQQELAERLELVRSILRGEHDTVTWHTKS